MIARAQFEPGPYCVSSTVRQYQLSFAYFKSNLITLNSPVFPMLEAAACDKRKREFMAGRLCAQRALQDIGIHDSQVQVAKDRSPVWPKGIIGSISHTDAFAAAAVVSLTALRSIGVDSERMVEDWLVDVIRRECLTTTEDTYLQYCSNSCDIRVLSTLFFSAKESVWKAMYPLTKELFEFRDVEICAFNFSAGLFRVRPVSAIGNSCVAGFGRFRLSGSFVHTSFELK